MSAAVFEKLHRINYLTAELDALYHQASFRLGLADSEMRVLYAIYDNGQSCLLSDIYKQSGISRQTVNSALRKLEAEGIVYLEQANGRSKRACMTEAGRGRARGTVARIFDAEQATFAAWTDDELNEYVRLLNKFVDGFRAQVEQL